METIPWIDEERIASEHKTLFHYTSVQKLKQIFESGGLLSSPFNQTNDSSEFRALESVIVEMMARGGLERIPTLFKQYKLSFAGSRDDFAKVCFEDAKSCFNALIKGMPAAPEIACFSYHEKANHIENGLLTQWRLYGGKGSGVALGFNARRIIDISNDSIKTLGVDTMFLDQVAYGAEMGQSADRLSEFSELPEIYARSVLAVLLDRRGIFEDLREELMKFFVLCASTKHPDFADEREIRLVVSPAIDETLADRKRLSKVGLRSLNPILPALSEILVGPSHDQDKIVSQVEKLTKIYERKDVQIKRSNTPFRFTG